VFDIMVAVIFQNIFYLEIHQNKFLFFKLIFNISTFSSK